ncbi:MAG: PAS domain S-box protein [Thermodesulfobacteriota bacterium]
MSRDIAYRKCTEEEFRKSEQRYRLLFESAPDGVSILDSEGFIVECNMSQAKLYGYSQEELLGKHITDLMTESSLPVFREEFSQLHRLQSTEVEIEMITSAGKIMHIWRKGVPLADEQGNFAGVLVYERDITDRKALDSALKEALKDKKRTNERMMALVECARAFLQHREFEDASRILFDKCKQIIGATSGYVALLSEDGSENEVLFLDAGGLPCTVDESLPMPIRGLRGDAYRTGKPVFDNDFRRSKWMEFMPEGHVALKNVLFAPMVISGKAVGLVGLANKPQEFTESDVGVIREFTEFAAVGLSCYLNRKALEKKTALLSTVLESLTHPFYMINAESYMIELANSALSKAGVSEGTTCYSATHSLSEPCNGLHHPCPVEEVKRTGQPAVVEHVHYDKEGRPRNIEIYVYPVLDSGGTVTHIVEYCLDVTDRVRAQEGLRENEKMLRNILSLSPSGISYFQNERLLWANKAMLQIFGHPESEEDQLLGCPAQSFFESEEEYRRVREIFRRQMLEGGHIELEARLRRRDGSTFLGNVMMSPQNPDIPESGTTVLVTDITDRKRIEEERSRLMIAIEQAAQAIVITDPEGTIQYVNPYFTTVTGYGHDEAIGQNPRILKSGKHDVKFYREMWDTLLRGEVWKGHFVNKKKDGTLFEEEATISPVKDPFGSIVSYVAVKRDVTERVHLEKQLRQAQKMEAIGTLAGGIAHDFNNILQIILGYSDQLIMGKHKNSPDLVPLKAIQTAAKDGANLVKRLLTFSRNVESLLRPINLNQQLKRVQEILIRTIPKIVQIRVSLAEDLKIVHADPVQLEQVLLNLAINAYQAMPKGGILEIKTENLTVDEGISSLYPWLELGEYVLLRVSDTGHGMDEKVLARIFEPFYTTKEEGKGTGLGLSIVYGIIKSHSGHITCSSEPGQGTTFTIYLPAVSEEEKFDASMPLGEMPPFATETILLVDDEENIRAILEHTLTRVGYKVFTAHNGSKAVEIYQERMQEIDLVVLDLNMPEMGGRRCLDAILKVDPEAKILISSGVMAEESEMAILMSRARGFIRKPFHAKDLLCSVRKVLDERGDTESTLSKERDVSGHITGKPLDNASESSGLSEPTTQRETYGIEGVPLKLRILVIDDRESYLKMLEQGLEQFGQIPFTAATGDEGLQVFQETPVDLVVCDLEMPELDGWEVGKQIKNFCREKQMPKTPLILLTGRTDMGDIYQDDAERMAECGVDAILEKPIDVPDILKVAERLMREAGRSFLLHARGLS